MKIKHTSKKSANRPFTGVPNNPGYNSYNTSAFGSSNLNTANTMKLRRPTYKKASFGINK